MFMIFAAKDNMYLCFVIPQATANLLHSNILSNQSSMDYWGIHINMKTFFIFQLKVFVNYPVTLKKGFRDVIAITDVALRK